MRWTIGPEHVASFSVAWARLSRALASLCRDSSVRMASAARSALSRSASMFEWLNPRGKRRGASAMTWGT